jgi:hypothetical protein
MKRKIILSIGAVLITIAIQAQNENEQPQPENSPQQLQTIFNQTSPIGWWIAPEFSYTMIDKKGACLAGLSGGIIINHNFSIGLAGTGILTNNNLKFSGINDTADVYLYGGYGGLILEYRINPVQPVNIAFPLLIGGGGAAYSTWGPSNWNTSGPDDHNDNPYNWDSYFVLEPGVMVGINLLKFMRLDAGVTYRLVQGLNLPETESGMMNGFNAKLSLKFGRF